MSGVHGRKFQKKGQEVKDMIKEIRFLPTGEIRQPRTGDWFLSAQNRPICAAQDFLTSKFQILKMEVIEEDDKGVHVMGKVSANQ